MNKTTLRQLLGAALIGSAPVSKQVQQAVVSLDSRASAALVALARRPNLDPEIRQSLTNSSRSDVAALLKLADLETFDAAKISDIRAFLKTAPAAAKDRALATYAKQPRPTLEAAIVNNCPPAVLSHDDVRVLIGRTRILNLEVIGARYLTSYSDAETLAHRLRILALSLGETAAAEMCLDPTVTAEGLSHFLIRPLPADALQVALSRFLQEVLHSYDDPNREIYSFLRNVLVLHGRTTRLKPFECPADCPCSTQHLAGNCYTQLRKLQVSKYHPTPPRGLGWKVTDPEIEPDPVELIQQFCESAENSEPLGYSWEQLRIAIRQPYFPRPLLKRFLQTPQHSPDAQEVVDRVVERLNPVRYKDDPEVLEVFTRLAPHRVLQTMGYEPFGGPEAVAELIPTWADLYEQRPGRLPQHLGSLRRCPAHPAVLKALTLGSIYHLTNAGAPLSGEWADELLKIISEELLPDEELSVVATTLLSGDTWTEHTLSDVITTVKAVAA